jgi:hypothetical protein
MEQAAKVKYVKKQKQSRYHTCHWPGCRTQVKPAIWGCTFHWYKLPKHLRDRVWATYRPGQEVDFNPSENYVKVARQIQTWIAEHFKTKEEST